MIDLDFYCWREPTKDAVGDDRLLVPRSDPFVHEYSVNQMWPTVQEAIDFRQEELDEEQNDAAGWVLVHYTGTVIPATT